MSVTALWVGDPGGEPPSLSSLVAYPDVAVDRTTPGAVGERLAADPPDCVVAHGSDAFDAVRVARDAGDPVPVVVHAPAAETDLAVACSRVDGVEYLPPDPPDGETLGDRVLARAGATPELSRAAALERLQDLAAAEDVALERRVRDLLDVGRAYLGVEGGFLSTVDRGTGRFEVAQSEGGPDLLHPGETSPLASTYCRRVVDGEGTLGVTDAEAEGWEGDPAFERYGLQCYLGTSIEVGGDLYGTLCFVDRSPRPQPFSRAETAFLELAAAWLGRELPREEDGRGPAAVQRVLSRVSDGFFATDEEWTVTYVNDRFEEVLGVPGEDLLGEHLWDAFPEAIERAFHDEYHRAMATQEPVEFEEYFPPVDTWFAVRAYPSETGLSVYFRDVTDRKLRERELEEYETVVETLREPVFALDGEGAFSLVADPLADRLGETPDAVEGRSLDAVLDAETAAACRSFLAGEGGHATTVEEGWVTDADGERFPVAVDLTRLGDGGAGGDDADAGEAAPAGAVGTLRDITRRRERERDLVFFHDMVAEAGIGVVAFGAAGTVAYANDAFGSLVGAAPGLEGTPAWDLLADVEPEGFAERWGALGDGETDAVQLRQPAADGEVRDLEVRVTKADIGATPYLFGTAVDVTRRRDRERALDALGDTARDLLAAEDASGVAEHVRDAATRVADVPYVAVSLFDEAHGVLDPVAVSDPLRAADGSLLGTGGDAGLAWETIVRGEPTVVSDVGEDPDCDAPDSPVGSALALPLGTHGVLELGAPEAGRFPGDAGEVARTLAANAEAALDRVADREALRRNERELSARTDQLRRLDRVNTVIRRIAGTVVQESTREDIGTAACERFVDVDPFACCWVGRPDATNDAVTPESWAGGDATPPAGEGGVPVADDPDAHPAGAAAATGEVRVRGNLLADRGAAGGAWRRRALARGYHACCAVPLAYDGTVRGVLVLYARKPDAFPDPVREVLAELGEMLGYALTAAERRGALARGRVTELAFDVGDADLPFARVAAALDCEVTLARAAVTGSGDPTLTYTVDGAAPEAVTAHLTARPSVADARAVATGEQSTVVEATLSGPWFGEAFLDEGGEVSGATADPDGGRVTARVPRGVDVRRVVESFRATHPEVSLATRREATPASGEPLALSRRLDERLTERQRAAVETAFYSGYFDVPRTATGGDVADVLGVSQPTVSEHLRLAQRETFAMLFDDGA